MDKNNKNNRTDLLAAGRKKLQQFRQKKDGGKGSKSSGKASKSEKNVDVPADAASSVAKPSELELDSKQQIPVGEMPGKDSEAGLLGSSEMHSRESSIASEIDAGTQDLSSISVFPEARTAEAPLTAEFPIQEVVIGEEGSGLTHGSEYSVDALAPDVARSSPVLDNGMSSGPSETSEILIVEGKSIEVGVPVLDDSSTPRDSVNASEAVELTSARGEDQVPDVGTMQDAASSVLEPDAGNNLMVLEGNSGPGFDEKAGVHAVTAQVDGRTVRETEPTSEPNDFSAFAGATDDIEEAQKTDTQPDSPRSLRISDAISSEHVTQPREDSMGGTSSEEVVWLPPSSDYFAVAEGQGSLTLKNR